MTRVRPISDALTPAMRGALARGEGRRPPQPSTVRGLVARRFVAPGSTRVQLRPTPLGRQVAAMLVDLHWMREALVYVGRHLDMAMGAASQPSEAARAHVQAARNAARGALARSRRWVP